MEDLSRIHEAVGRARRRLRLQRALEGAATAAPLGAAGAVLGVAAARFGMCAPETAALGAALSGGALLVVAGIAAAWPLDDEGIARRLDRASGLADRLSTAVAFARDGRDRRGDSTSAGLARLAIRDGVRVAGRADPRRAAPIHRPRDFAVAGTSVLVALLVAGLGVWGGIANVGVPDAAPRGAWHHAGSSPRQAQIASEDLDYLRRQVGKLRAQAEEDRSLATVLEIAEIEEQIDAVDRGDADRADLLGALNAVARRGHLAGIEDVLETVRHSRPPPREPPAAPPPPPTPTPPGGDGRTPSKVPGTASGQAPGDVHDPELRGDRTRARAATEDVRVTAADERATTRRETVRSAAKHGFAGAPYRRVYAEYEAIVGDVMHAEEVPGTRRYVIERYFDRIRPW